MKVKALNKTKTIRYLLGILNFVLTNLILKKKNTNDIQKCAKTNEK